MSVTFKADLPDEGLPVLEPCLCTQMDEHFSQWMQYGAGEPSVMQAAADPGCYMCKGTGVERYSRPTLPELNLANANAEALFNAMGIKKDYWYGEMTVVEARRGVVRARNTRINVPPKPAWSAVFGGPRIIGGEITEESILERVNRFAHFVDTVSKLGAKKITWY